MIAPWLTLLQIFRVTAIRELIKANYKGPLIKEEGEALGARPDPPEETFAEYSLAGNNADGNDELPEHEKVNQDTFMSWASGDFVAYGVFDGHGDRGERGSLGAKAVAQHFRDGLAGITTVWNERGDDAYKERMLFEFKQANSKAYDAGKGGSGTTATLVVVRKAPSWNVSVWWAGDSPAKILMAGAKPYEIQGHTCQKGTTGNLTAEWTPYGWHCTFGKAGSYTQVTRSLGEAIKAVSPVPEFADWSAHALPGSVVVLGSDGFYDAPMNAVLAPRWPAIISAFEGAPAADADTKEIVDALQSQEYIFDDVPVLEREASAWEADHITTPLLAAAKKGSTALQQTLEEVTTNARRTWVDLDNAQGGGGKIDDTTAVVALLSANIRYKY